MTRRQDDRRRVAAALSSLVAAVGILRAQTVAPRPLPDPPPPSYPEAALIAGIEGAVRYRAIVGPDGVVKSVQILEVPAKGYGFEDAVQRTVSGWRFTPATSDGVQVEGVHEGFMPFAPTLPGEFVFGVTPADAWTAIQELAGELKLGSEKLDKERQVLVTRSIRYREDVYPSMEALGLPPARSWRRSSGIWLQLRDSRQRAWR